MVVKQILNKGMDIQSRGLRFKATLQLIISIIAFIAGIVLLFFQPLGGVLLLVIGVIAFLGSRYSRSRANRIDSVRL